MSTRFVACEACARHVRAGDSVCPFCGAKGPRVAPQRSLPQRLSRAALHAAGAATAIVTLDCSSSSGSVEAFYGAPCIDGSCGPYTVDSGQDATYYDGPLVNPPDAGEAATAVDASFDAADALPGDGATQD